MGTIGEQTNLADALDVPEIDLREFKRGEVYFVDLEDTAYGTRYLQTKTRPALIIQNDIGNQRGATLIVALITSKFKKPYPFQYRYQAADGKENVIMFEQILTIDKFRVLNKLGELTYQQMQEADAALMYSLGLNRFSLENILSINVVSLMTEKTRYATKMSYIVHILFTNGIKEIKIPLEKLKEYYPELNQDMDFDTIIDKLNCCRGLNWLVNNNEF